jgi:Tfp pilus assembly protein FimV
MLLAACGGSSTAPPTTPTTAATSAATIAPTTAATSGGGGSTDACAALDALDAAFKAPVPDYEHIVGTADGLVEIAGTLEDQGQATLLASIGTDAADAAKAFLNGDLAKGARLQNRVLATIPPARVALDCS